jgi:DNA polymerase II small subunit/DNA polymerase delta subunit B
LTEIGFYEFVCDHPETRFDTDCPDLSDYFENKDNRYSAFIRICSRIKRGIKNDQITGGMVGQYNPSITQRLNNLTERVDTTTKGEAISEIKVNIITSNKE